MLFHVFKLTGITSSLLVIKQGTLKGGRTYRLKLDARVHGYADTYTLYEFDTNLPPYGGECGIIPEKGQ